MSGMTAQLNSLTNMVSAMNAQNVCDAECQNKRKVENLRKEFVKAQQNHQNSLPNLERAEKDYIIADRGAGYYSQLQEAKYKKKAQDSINEWNKTINSELSQLEKDAKYYNGLYIYKKNIDVIKDGYIAGILQNAPGDSLLLAVKLPTQSKNSPPLVMTHVYNKDKLPLNKAQFSKIRFNNY